MITNLESMFITHYNQSAPNWKKIKPNELMTNINLQNNINAITTFVSQNNLDPKRLVYAIVKFYYKNNKYPSILLFKGEKALSLYKNYELPQTIEINNTQKIMLFVKKSKKLLNNLEKNGIIYSKGVKILHDTGKADPYFLLAHGIKEGVSNQILKEWEQSDELKNLVLNIILA